MPSASKSSRSAPSNGPTRAYSDRMDRNTLRFSCIGACSYRKTGVHFSGTCARARIEPEEKIMSRSITFTVVTTAALGIGFPPDAAFSQQKSLREQLVGVWTLVSAEATPAGGAKRQDFGANPKGILILDAGGRYALVQGSPD